ncbi:hypothetical protein BDV12DRAFT_181285 [Aspergillus spectabilis]
MFAWSSSTLILSTPHLELKSYSENKDFSAEGKKDGTQQHSLTTTMTQRYAPKVLGWASHLAKRRY